MITAQLLFSSILLGIGLAMDAFSVSLANGLAEPQGSRRRALAIAGIFATFQAVMPLLGWFLVHTAAGFFTAFQRFIPFIALALLLFIGIKMILGGAKECKCTDTVCVCRTAFSALLIQGIATSIDALSVGFTIADYTAPQAAVSAALIGAVTLLICFVGVRLGRVFGTRFAGKASILGGSVLVIVGLEIFITGLIK